MAIDHANLLDSTIVNYPTVLPTQQWLKDRLLWAERVGSIWPADGVIARSDQDGEVLEALDALSGDALFVELNVDICKKNQKMIREVVASFQLPQDAWTTWEAEAGLTAHDVGEAVETEIPPDTDRDLVIYSGKLPSPLAIALAAENIAVQRDEGRWLEMRSGEDAVKLLSILSRYAKPRHAGAREYPTILDPTSPMARNAACVPSKTGAVSALCIDIPLLKNVKADVGLEQVLEFRSKDANERARREYLAAVSASVCEAKTLYTSSEEFIVSALHKMNLDMQGSAKTLGKRAMLAGLLGAASVVTADILVPLTQGLTAATIAAAAATAVGMGAGATVVRINRTGVDAYLSNLRGGGLLT